MVPGTPPLLLFDGSGAVLAAFGGSSVLDVSGVAIARAIAPDAVLPLTLLDASNNQTFTFDRDAVTVGAWRRSSAQPAGWVDTPAEEHTSAAPARGD
jgi:hypothetical protein